MPDYIEPEPPVCPKCHKPYPPTYLVCPECGYPASDLALFEADDRELDNAKEDCTQSKHDWQPIFMVIGVLSIDGCVLCGAVRIRLIKLDRTFLVRYRPEFKRFDRQS